jgi:hypothetical protein
MNVLLSLSKAYINRLGNDKGGRIPALTVGILGVVNPPLHEYSV